MSEPTQHRIQLGLTSKLRSFVSESYRLLKNSFNIAIAPLPAPPGRMTAVLGLGSLALLPPGPPRLADPMTGGRCRAETQDQYAIPSEVEFENSPSSGQTLFLAQSKDTALSLTTTD